ncbi:hypothetical protein SAMN04488009_2850 [Maribacter sedimenticola]|uniref:Uncharacterized protein n=1 Tax=Maribacter sedimenticola TaxID=228956 RepID=A0ABY1SJR5_9FLAO|nr:DUF6090 family protein [Maribacter sedimenticola]SNR63179.1 hypothetical protein SAMN04488009_2850 [Maribacter sedimenticola]
MIKFFRKIRQNLLSEGKTEKYLKYAIGEIVLVVIGILIALQINNWNEKRKINNAEIEILQNLKTELRYNLKDLENINKQHKSEFEDGLFILKLFGTDISSFAESTLDSLMSNAFAGYSFEAKDGYIKSLIASNKIDYLQNAELKSYISSFESMVIDANQEDGYVRKLLNERFWPATDGKISALNSISSTETYKEFPKGTYPSDYKWFFNNREVEDITANIFAWKKENVIDEQALIVKIKRMIEIINIELNEK